MTSSFGTEKKEKPAGKKEPQKKASKAGNRDEIMVTRGVNFNFPEKTLVRLKKYWYNSLRA